MKNPTEVPTRSNSGNSRLEPEHTLRAANTAEFDWGARLKNTIPPVSLVLSVASAVTLGRSIEVQNGTFSLEAITWLTVSIVAAFLAEWPPPALRNLRITENHLAGALAIGLAAQFAQLLSVSPIGWSAPSGSVLPAPFFAGALLAALLAALLYLRPEQAYSRWLPLLLLVFLALGVWTIRESPRPFIDVFMFQQQGCALLIHGRNPFAGVYPDIFFKATHHLSPYYGPGLSKGGVLQFGFLYPPLTLLLDLPGYLLLGDCRYSLLLAIVATAILIAWMRPGRIAALTSALFLFTPRVFFILEMSWTEPYVLLFSAGIVLVAIRSPRWTPTLLALVLSIKQHLALLMLLLTGLTRGKDQFQDAVKIAVRSLPLLILLNLPFLVWSPHAYIRSVWQVQFWQPFRSDALSYLALVARLGGPQLPSWVSFAVAAALLAGVRYRGVKTPAQFALAAAVLYLGIFAFAKQAFCNYYYFVVGTLCCAIAAEASAGRPIGEPPAVNGIAIGTEGSSS